MFKNNNSATCFIILCMILFMNLHILRGQDMDGDYYTRDYTNADMIIIKTTGKPLETFRKLVFFLKEEGFTFMRINEETLIFQTNYKESRFFDLSIKGQVVTLGRSKTEIYIQGVAQVNSFTAKYEFEVRSKGNNQDARRAGWEEMKKIFTDTDFGTLLYYEFERLAPKLEEIEKKNKESEIPVF